MPLQLGKARLAARTAASTSSAPERGTSSNTSPVAGLYTGRAGRDTSFHSPPIRFLSMASPLLAPSLAQKAYPVIRGSPKKRGAGLGLDHKG